jgi:hypothetical protein
MDNAKALKLLDKIRKEAEASNRALDRSHRSTGGTATWRRAYESYEKHSEAFDAAVAELRRLLMDEPIDGTSQG